MITVNKTNEYHIPVLASQVCRFLITKKDGVYLDGTLGGGGHAEYVLRQLSPHALYIGIDRDPDALRFARRRLQDFSGVVFFRGTYAEMDAALAEAGVEKADGILLDLGISSHQVDDENRGFTFRSGVKLDMRMDAEGDTLTAAEVLQSYDLKQLTRIFREYGEERRAYCIARKIVAERAHSPIVTSDALIRIIDRCVARKHVKKSYARIFQALRIEVNQELEQLKVGLEKAVNLLNPGGRLVVISYHSLEDRIVKRFLREQENPCECPPELPVCQCGKKPTMKRIRPYLITPDEEEVKENPRARSAKMRVGEKL